MRLDLACTRCALSRSRTQVVPPDGDLDSIVCFVGEAPGEKEDLTGKPFVGRAGKMLDKLLRIEELDRKRIMITNTVKCRPPENRNPTAEEMTACFPYLEQELEGRKLAVAMGRVACADLIGDVTKLGSEANIVRKVKVGRDQIDVLPAYHPSACLFNVQARKSLQESIRIAKGFIDDDR